MIPHPDSMIMLAGFRHNDLQDEVARIRLLREMPAGRPTLTTAIATACRELGATLARARQHLDTIKAASPFGRDASLRSA